MDAREEISRITRELEHLQKRYDQVAALSRSAIRYAGEAITLIHIKDRKAADSKIRLLKNEIAKLRKVDGSFEYYSQQAYQEYVEAIVLYNLIWNGKLMTSKDLSVGPVEYMLGLMDVFGELKREAYEAMRHGKSEDAEKYYNIMRELYDATMHIRFANAIMPGFRKKQDVARIQLETTGSDLLRFHK
jgi:translin